MIRRHWRAHEKALMAHLAHEHIATVLRLYAVNCVLDVGANRGQYARMLRRRGYRGHIVSFEPVATTFAEWSDAPQAIPNGRCIGARWAARTASSP
jgi:predicted xylose isomerase-like sugar epimerase